MPSKKCEQSDGHYYMADDRILKVKRKTTWTCRRTNQRKDKCQIWSLKRNELIAIHVGVCDSHQALLSKAITHSGSYHLYEKMCQLLEALVPWGAWILDKYIYIYRPAGLYVLIAILCTILQIPYINLGLC